MFDIDTSFDFTTDTPNYWTNYWETDSLLGHAGNDPDLKSRTLCMYSQRLWSRELPNGQIMSLQIKQNDNSLYWGDFRFGSDSIIVSFRYKRYREMIEKVSRLLPDYHSYIEHYIRKSCTIGGKIIFPKIAGGINQSRGCNPYIEDRWDLTLECIRLYYQNQPSPLYEVLGKNKAFFDLFVDFKGYVDFFLLQDCVNSDYSKVNFWMDFKEFAKMPLPKSPDEYMLWIENELTFVEQRNKRINDYLRMINT